MDTTATIQQGASSASEDAQRADEHGAPAPISADKSPQEFYAEINSRADVRAILKELASRETAD